jgi:hypothetical protein
MSHLVRSRGYVLLLVFTALPALASAQPVLSVSPTLVNAQGSAGTNLTSQTVQVRNDGKRALKWSVVGPTANWLVVSPTSGTNAGSVTLSFQTSALPVGVYGTAFAVQSNTGQSILITVGIQIDAAAAVLPPTGTTSPGGTTTTSPDGTTTPPAASIVDAAGAIWTVGADRGILRNNVHVGTGDSILWKNSTIYVNNRTYPDANGSWWQWAGGSWTQVANPLTGSVSPAPAPAPAPTPPPSGVGPQSTIACPAGAVDIWPGQSIPLIVSSYPSSTTFCLRAGVHYLTSSVTPKTGNTFVGEYGAILDGSGWSTTDDTQAAFRAHNQDIDYVTIRNLVIRNMPQQGIHAYYWMADHWTLEFNEIAYNKIGVEFAPDFLIRNNYIHHNVGISPSSTNPAERGGGYQGFRSDNTTFDSNEIAYNGREQKVGLSANVTFRNNFVHHNIGDGIWYDTNSNAGAVIHRGQPRRGQRTQRDFL